MTATARPPLAWIKLPNPRWHFIAHSQRFLQIPGVRDRLAAEMIVRDHVRLLALRHRLDSRHPRAQLLARIKVVVALPRLGVREPLLVIAPVQARVPDGTGD